MEKFTHNGVEYARVDNADSYKLFNGELYKKVESQERVDKSQVQKWADDVAKVGQELAKASNSLSSIAKAGSQAKIGAEFADKGVDEEKEASKLNPSIQLLKKVSHEVSELNKKLESLYRETESPSFFA